MAAMEASSSSVTKSDCINPLDFSTASNKIVFSSSAVDFLFLCHRLRAARAEQVGKSYAQAGELEKQLNEETQRQQKLSDAKLKAKVEVSQRNQRHYMGEELDSLNLKELQSLEQQQLDSALKHIRTRKNQLMFESISNLKKKVRLNSVNLI
ncbi:hypothetical protein LWI29_038248 [Acer saccharum]|uniref:K-box domain-containing protein n=1 Tax=Acer saccharum TaxID=4024 RepID=A0AA39SAJ7_ACESA|nr:hypothetical protein LWI29_038248 [Acer saccharum]